MILLKTKTFWFAIVGLVGVLAGYLSGTMSSEQALAAAWAAIQSILIRHAIAKVQAPG